MEAIILVSALSLLLSAWALSYMFISSRNNIQRHEAWRIKKHHDLQLKMDTLLEQEKTLRARINELKNK